MKLDQGAHAIQSVDDIRRQRSDPKLARAADDNADRNAQALKKLNLPVMEYDELTDTLRPI